MITLDHGNAHVDKWRKYWT